MIDASSHRSLVSAEGSIFSPGYPRTYADSSQYQCNFQSTTAASFDINVTMVDADFDHDNLALHKPCYLDVRLNNKTSCRGNAMNWNTVITSYQDATAIKLQVKSHQDIKVKWWITFKSKYVLLV